MTDFTELVRATDYRSFLKCLFKDSSGFAEFARRAGFASRSYPREVMLGKKRIGPKSLQKFLTGLRLPKEIKTYFAYLVHLEEPDTNFERLSAQHLSRKITDIRRQMANPRRVNKGEIAPEVPIYAQPRGPEIYAALGDPQVGATVKELQSRTGYSEAACVQSLISLSRAGLVTQDKATKRYFPQDLHLVLNKRRHDRFFKEFYMNSVLELPNAAQKLFDRDEALFFSSVFLVDKRRLKELRAELWNLLVKYVDNTESSSGDQLVKLVSAFYESNPAKREY